ncbi:MAG: RHS repeat domain-containing protein [Saprospiraceae bacterium]
MRPTLLQSLFCPLGQSQPRSQYAVLFFYLQLKKINYFVKHSVNFSGVSNYYVQDHLGNTRVVYQPVFCGNQTNGEPMSYEVEYVGDYFPYRKTIREYIKRKKEKFLTTEHERDEETGLDYRGARFYDSDIGRFLSLDPLAIEFADVSPYNYVLGNPISLVDPDGRSPDQGDLGSAGATIVFQKQEGISDEDFGEYMEYYMNNVMEIWGDKGTGGKITFKVALGDYTLGKNETLVQVGRFEGPSHVYGKNVNLLK